MSGKYLVNESTSLITALSTNLKQAQIVIVSLEKGTSQLVSSLQSGDLKGKTYGAARDYVLEVLVPLTKKASDGIEDGFSDLNTYKYEDSQIAHYGNIDVDKLKNERNIKEASKRKVTGQREMLQALPLSALAVATPFAYDTAVKNMFAFEATMNDSIKKIDEKLMAYETFEANTNHLFGDTEATFDALEHALEALENIKISGAGNSLILTMPSNINNLVKKTTESKLISGNNTSIEQKYSDDPEALKNIQNLSSTMGISLEEAEKLYLQFQKLGKDQEEINRIHQMTEEVKLRSGHTDITFEDWMTYYFNVFLIGASFGEAYGYAKALGWGKEFLNWWEAKGTTKPVEKPVQTPKPKLNFEGTPHIHQGKQDKHVENSLNYKQQVSNGKHPSILTADPEQLLHDFAGKGHIDSPTKETVNFGKPIGKFYDVKTGKYEITNRGTIHYDKNGGAHIVPSRPY